MASGVDRRATAIANETNDDQHMTIDQAKPSTDRLTYQGEMTIYSAAANYQQLKEYLEKGLPIRLDLSQVSEIDSSGLQLILLARTEADAHGLEFSIVGVSDTVEEVLRILFLKRTFGLQHHPRPETRA